MELAEQLDEMCQDLDPAGVVNYKLLLGSAAGGLAWHGDPPTEGVRATALRTALKCLSQLQATGPLFKGRPPFMTDSLLRDLRAEAIDRRREAIKTDRYFLGCGGPHADKLAGSSELAHFVGNYAPDVEPTGVASYVTYDEPGCGLSPHIDTEIFSLNALIMLRHDYIADPPAANLLFDPDGNMERILLEPGEMLLFYAGGTVHGREDVREGEEINIVTIGFQPTR